MIFRGTRRTTTEIEDQEREGEVREEKGEVKGEEAEVREKNQEDNITINCVVYLSMHLYRVVWQLSCRSQSVQTTEPRQ